MGFIEVFFSSFSPREKLVYFISWFFILGFNLYFFFKKKSFEASQQKNTAFRMNFSIIKSSYRSLLLLNLLFLCFLVTVSFLRNSPVSIEVEKILSFLFLLSIFVSVLHFFKQIEQDFHDNKKEKMKREGETKAEGFFLFAKIFVFFLGFLMTLQIFEVSINSVLAIGGIGGVFFGMAARDFLSNAFGGMMLFINQHFAIGDYIEAERNIHGKVEHIGIYSTLLRTPSHSVVSVPNQLFSQMVLNNFSRKDFFPVEMTFSLKTKNVEEFQALLSKMKKLTEKDPKIDSTKGVQISLKNFEEGIFNITFFASAKAADENEANSIRQALHSKLLKLIT